MVARPIEDPSERYLEIGSAEGIVVLGSDGGTRLPSRFREEDQGAAARTADFIVALARRLARSR